MTDLAADLTPRYAELLPGDPAPYFSAPTENQPAFAFDTIGGRYVALCFFPSSESEEGKAAIKAMIDDRALFDDEHVSIFGVTTDPEDAARLRNRTPGIRFFHDVDGRVSRLYGALPADPAMPGGHRPFWMLLDPSLRVIRRDAFGPGVGASFVSRLRALPPPQFHAGFEIPPPVIVLPRIFDPSLCTRLIGLYEEHGGKESGFMREVDGKTIGLHDYKHKRRSDYTIEDPALIRQLQKIFMRRIFPEIARVHHFRTTRMERYIVGCYDAAEGGHFRAHRDNTTKGTAHRKFAVSINLNDDFDGGEVSFPEFSRRSFKAPAGGAVIFSGSLLHAVSKVTRGRRYAFLPFLYDEAAARLRAENNKFLGEGVGSYGMGSPAET